MRQNRTKRTVTGYLVLAALLCLLLLLNINAAAWR